MEKLIKGKPSIRLIETLTSALYNEPIVIFREYVQNSVDAYSKARKTVANGYDFRIDIDVLETYKDNSDINIYLNDNYSCEKVDYTTAKRVIVLDNGFGITDVDDSDYKPGEFSPFFYKMTRIGGSDKSSSLDQIGFRGIGRLSGLPFCDILLFVNKIEGSNKLDVFIWDGLKYKKLLDDNDQNDLDESIDLLTKYEQFDYDGDASDHFFRVELINYNGEISDLIQTSKFAKRLPEMLPVGYKSEFSKYASDIHKAYKDFMNEDLSDFEYNIYFNSSQLYKPYTSNHIFETGISFLKFKMKDGDRAGLMWFTFPRKIKGLSKSEPHGIYIRSKNMLMGNQVSFADVVDRSAKYITTYRELTQTFQGVYGELLLHSPKLSDNARRDWFKVDESSRSIMAIMVDFAERLLTFRKVSSKWHNSPNKDDLVDAMREAFLELADKSDYEFIDDLSDITEDDKPLYDYADEDFPKASATIKKFYEKLAICMREYYSSENKISEFLKLRQYIVDNFDNIEKPEEE